MSDKMIVVEGSGPFIVHVRGEGVDTSHEVSVSPAAAARWRAQPVQLVRAGFAFLLDREPAQAILTRFDFDVIAHYFPHFEREFPPYLDKTR